MAIPGASGEALGDARYRGTPAAQQQYNEMIGRQPRPAGPRGRQSPQQPVRGAAPTDQIRNDATQHYLANGGTQANVDAYNTANPNASYGQIARDASQWYADPNRMDMGDQFSMPVMDTPGNPWTPERAAARTQADADRNQANRNTNMGNYFGGTQQGMGYGLPPAGGGGGLQGLIAGTPIGQRGGAAKALNRQREAMAAPGAPSQRFTDSFNQARSLAGGGGKPSYGVGGGTPSWGGMIANPAYPGGSSAGGGATPTTWQGLGRGGGMGRQNPLDGSYQGPLAGGGMIQNPAYPGGSSAGGGMGGGFAPGGGMSGEALTPRQMQPGAPAPQIMESGLGRGGGLQGLMARNNRFRTGG